MKTIEYYQLSIMLEKQEVYTREFALPVHVKIEQNVLGIWALVDTNNKNVWRTIYSIETNGEVPNNNLLHYIGTVKHGSVRHIFIEEN